MDVRGLESDVCGEWVDNDGMDGRVLVRQQ